MSGVTEEMARFESFVVQVMAAVGLAGDADDATSTWQAPKSSVVVPYTLSTRHFQGHDQVSHPLVMLIAHAMVKNAVLYLRALKRSKENAEQGMALSGEAVCCSLVGCVEGPLSSNQSATLHEVSTVTGSALDGAHEMVQYLKNTHKDIGRVLQKVVEDAERNLKGATLHCLGTERNRPSNIFDVFQGETGELLNSISLFLDWWSDRHAQLEALRRTISGSHFDDFHSMRFVELFGRWISVRVQYIMRHKELEFWVECCPTWVSPEYLDSVAFPIINIRRTLSEMTRPDGLLQNMPLVFQHFSLYVFNQLWSHGSLRSSSWDKSIQEWRSWNFITCFVNYRRICETLWHMLRECPDNVGLQSVVKLRKHIHLDIDALCSRLAALLSDKDEYRELLSKRGSEARSLLSLMHELLNWPNLDALYKRPFVGAYVRLARESGQYLESLVLTGVDIVGTQPLAAGQFGDVWKGRHRGRKVCIKALRVNERNLARLFKGFAHEIAVWSRLSHPNILPLYGVHHWDGNRKRLCLVSPWMVHGNVVQFIAINPDTDRHPLMLDIAQGLEYLHSMTPTIVHGDLKGVNVLVTPSGRACLADFGFAAPRDSRAPLLSSFSTAPTAGTIGWMAPELLDPVSPYADKEGRSTPASDIYAFACLAYELFAGAPPFASYTSQYALRRAVISGARAPRPSPAVCAVRALDDATWALIATCWDAVPRRRLPARRIVQRLREGRAASVDVRPFDQWDAPVHAETASMPSIVPSEADIAGMLGLGTSHSPLVNAAPGSAVPRIVKPTPRLSTVAPREMLAQPGFDPTAAVRVISAHILDLQRGA